LIIRIKDVHHIDATGLHVLEQIYRHAVERQAVAA